MTHWNHPGWFAYFPCNNSPPSILGEMLTADPRRAVHVLGDVARGYRAGAGGDGLAAADARACRRASSASSRTPPPPPRWWRCSRPGSGPRQGGPARHGLAAAGAPLTVYASREAHSSIDKAVKLAGYGLERLRARSRPTTPSRSGPRRWRGRSRRTARPGSGRPAWWPRSGRRRPRRSIRCRPIAELCRRHGAWLHVDAAYAGAAAIVPELRPLFDGMEQADSIVFNPHKWLLTNFDCTAYFVRDPAALLGTFQATPGVSPHRLRRRGRQLPRLGHPARPPVPGAQALVRDPELRRRGAAGDDPAARGAGAGARRLGRRRSRVRADGAGAVRAGVLPLAAAGADGGGAGRAQRAAARGGERAGASAT